MASPTSTNGPTTAKDQPKFYAVIDYEDSYVQPLILSALSTKLPPSTYQLIKSHNDLPTPTSPLLQFLPYESLDFTHLLSHPQTSLGNAYIIRKALIRKHYLSTTIANWVVKYPDSALRRHVKPSVDFEVDYAEFLDDALVEAWELKESWERGKEKEASEREWWILKPGMSERGQGIRLFSSEEELTSIFEEWEEELSDSDDDNEEDDDAEARSDVEPSSPPTGPTPDNSEEKKEKDHIITSHLRHFIAQPYIHPPVLFANKKFHIRTYVLATGALSVYVYKPMLALFAARPYLPPWESATDPEGLRAHLTNTCLQETGEREGSVVGFWDLPDIHPTSPPPPPSLSSSENPNPNAANWKKHVFEQIQRITGETFEAAARGMSIHFQPLPNAFEVFGVDFMVGLGERGELVTYLLEVNAFPDFKQTGEGLRDLVQGLFEGVVEVAVEPFFEAQEEGKEGTETMIRVLDLDLGRR